MSNRHSFKALATDLFSRRTMKVFHRAALPLVLLFAAAALSACGAARPPVPSDPSYQAPAHVAAAQAQPAQASEAEAGPTWGGAAKALAEQLGGFILPGVKRDENGKVTGIILPIIHEIKVVERPDGAPGLVDKVASRVHGGNINYREGKDGDGIKVNVTRDETTVKATGYDNGNRGYSYSTKTYDY